MSEPFEWVQRRHECSLSLMFIKLRHGVEKDVNKRNALRDERNEKAVTFNVENIEGEADSFQVFIQTNQKIEGVKFVKTADTIAVQELKTARLLFEGSLALNEEGDCRLKVASGKERKELELWQFRMRALEDVFFGRL